MTEPVVATITAIRVMYAQQVDGIRQHSPAFTCDALTVRSGDPRMAIAGTDDEIVSTVTVDIGHAHVPPFRVRRIFAQLMDVTEEVDIEHVRRMAASCIDPRVRQRKRSLSLARNGVGRQFLIEIADLRMPCNFHKRVRSSSIYEFQAKLLLIRHRDGGKKMPSLQVLSNDRFTPNLIFRVQSSI